jgi:nicotinamidase-related amidase
VCIKANVLDGLKNNFDIELVEAGIRGLSPDGHRATLEYLRSLNGKRNQNGHTQSVRIIPE